ncbi:MAG TPA: extensin family protein [Allosphingosinicella sp.]
MRKALLLALFLPASCIPQVDAPEKARAVAPAEPGKATLQCHVELRREGVEFRALPDRTFENGCTAIGAVQLRDIGTPVANLGAMTCPLARQFARWTREALQPAAERWLKSRVARVESFGTYACRPVNGQAGGRLSEHGRSNAVDVGAFVLADGRRVTVLDGWNGGDEDVRRFLRDVHQAGCRRFPIVLGPEANAFHHNHFHFDMGQGPYCR